MAFCRPFAKDVAPQVNETIAFAREHYIPVIYTLHGELARNVGAMSLCLQL